MPKTNVETPSTHCCQHYPNRILHKKHLAAELGVCEKTVSNLMKSGTLPEPRWLNSIPVWMLYDVHAHISSGGGELSRSGAGVETATEKAAKPSTTKGSAHKAGKHSV